MLALGKDCSAAITLLFLLCGPDMQPSATNLHWLGIGSLRLSLFLVFVCLLQAIENWAVLVCLLQCQLTVKSFLYAFLIFVTWPRNVFNLTRMTFIYYYFHPVSMLLIGYVYCMALLTWWLCCHWFLGYTFFHWGNTRYRRLHTYNDFISMTYLLCTTYNITSPANFDHIRNVYAALF